jgi:hypothetical protein
MALLEKPVSAIRSRFTAPTLYTRPKVACPRCDGRRLVVLDASRANPYLWHECSDCQHLWALPRGWEANEFPSHHVIERSY